MNLPATSATTSPAVVQIAPARSPSTGAAPSFANVLHGTHTSKTAAVGKQVPSQSAHLDASRALKRRDVDDQRPSPPQPSQYLSPTAFVPPVPATVSAPTPAGPFLLLSSETQAVNGPVLTADANSAAPAPSDPTQPGVVSGNSMNEIGTDAGTTTVPLDPPDHVCDEASQAVPQSKATAPAHPVDESDSPEIAAPTAQSEAAPPPTAKPSPSPEVAAITDATNALLSNDLAGGVQSTAGKPEIASSSGSSTVSSGSFSLRSPARSRIALPQNSLHAASPSPAIDPLPPPTVSSSLPTHNAPSAPASKALHPDEDSSSAKDAAASSSSSPQLANQLIPPSSPIGPSPAAASLIATPPSVPAPALVSSSAPGTDRDVSFSQAPPPHEVAPGDPAAALSKVDVARLVRSAAGTELRVGVHSEDFGNVTIHATLGREQLSAHISTESERLGSALATHLSAVGDSMSDRIGKAVSLRTSVSVGTEASADQSGAGRDKSRQDSAAQTQTSSSLGGNNSNRGQQYPSFSTSGGGATVPGTSVITPVAYHPSTPDRLSIRV